MPDQPQKSESQEYVSLPMFTKVDPFAYLPEGSAPAPSVSPRAAEIDRLKGAEPVAVKPLEWSNTEPFSWYAVCPISRKGYIIDFEERKWWACWNVDLAGFDTLDAAKAAAQADYEARIRSALVAAPVPAEPAPVKPRCTICNGTGVTDQRFGMGTEPGTCPVCSQPAERATAPVEALRSPPSGTVARDEIDVTIRYLRRADDDLASAGERLISTRFSSVRSVIQDAIAVLERSALAKPATAPAASGVDWRRVVRDAFVAGCNAVRERSPLYAGEYADRTIAALSQPAPAAVPEGLRRVRHKKRGSIYEVLGEAVGQVSTNADGTPIDLGLARGRMATEGAKLTIYRDPKDGRLFWRFPDEFEDGRFESAVEGEA